MVVVSLVLCLFQSKLTPLAKLDSPLIPEMSGIVKSRKYKDTYWVHNDSGDSARIFAIHQNGKLIQPHQANYEGIRLEGSTNYDFEDIAIDGETIYVSDCGNNGNMRKDLCVYMLREPNPLVATSMKNVKKIRIAYPDQTATTPFRYDCEGIAAWKGTIYFITKWRSGRSNIPDVGASIYSLSKPSLDKVNVLKKLDTKTDLGGWVTAADISPDGKKLAILTQFPQQSVWVFDMTKGEKIFQHPIKQIPFTGGNQCEALCWNSMTSLIVGNEQRELFSLAL